MSGGGGALTRRRIETAVAILAVAAVSSSVGCGGGGAKVKLEKVGTFTEPIHLAQPPGDGDFLFVVEKRGVVRVIQGESKLTRPFLDISNRVLKNEDERGMFSIEFAPGYQQSGRFYLAYTERPRGELAIEEYRRSVKNPLEAERSSARRLLTIPQGSSDHHGGLLLFGPDDQLYIGSGDGGPSGDPRNVSQSKRTLLGKILRIDPRKSGRRPYSVPKDNPFVGRPGRDEIFAYGFRNPWRFTFVPAGGAMVIGDVGQDAFEEVDFVPVKRARGGNFGWNAYEGFAPYRGGVPKSRTIEPLLTYPHSKGCSIIGGPVVADSGLAAVAGNYLFGDFCTGRLYRLDLDGGRSARDHRLDAKPIPQLTSFGEDNAGHVYATSQAGPVYRLVGD